MDDKQWLGDLWGVSKETWYELWVNSIPAAIGGFFALAVAMLIFRMEHGKARRRFWSDANLDFIKILSDIGHRGFNAGPDFNPAELNAAAQRCATACPLPRKRASLLVMTFHEWMSLWRYVAIESKVPERTLTVPYRRSDFLIANEAYFFTFMASLHVLEGASPLKMWTFYERCYSSTRDMLNKRYALVAEQERKGARAMEVSWILPLPLRWKLPVGLANRLGLYPNMFRSMDAFSGHPFQMATL